MAYFSCSNRGAPSNLFATIDMGTNSFKMLIIRADSNGKFLTLNRLKEPVVLGRDTSTTISAQSQLRALQALMKFKQVIEAHHIDHNHTRCVATAAVREAANSAQFSDFVRENTGLEVDVLSGEEEGRLCYLGVLQFLPIHHKLVLTVDIGGGSTEFVIGKQGQVLFGISLKLGHVNLTQRFINHGEILKMREHIRLVIRESGLIEKVKEYGFEVAVGSSGTIRAIEKAVFCSYPHDMNHIVNSVPLFEEYRSAWKFNRGELSSVVESLCCGGDINKVKRDEIFKRRSEFIIAGAVLLEEIFELLGIQEIEISGYALGEGVIAETLAKVYNGYDLMANARWLSVLRLATRFNSKKRMRFAAQFAVIAKVMFEGLRKCNDQVDVSLDDKSLEYVEAACLLHSIGLVTGKKGYHKQSFHIIMNGGHLHGYGDEEVKLIALLARHHRKKFPKFDHSSFTEFSKQVKQKFRILCSIIRISFILLRYQCIDFEEMEFSSSSEGFKVVFREVRDHSNFPDEEEIGAELRKELENFKKVFQQDLLVVLPLRTSKAS